MVFLFCCVEKRNESATSEEEQVKSMYRQEGRTAKLALRSKVLTGFRNFKEYRKIFLFSLSKENFEFLVKNI